jgi:hypothetical protein
MELRDIGFDETGTPIDATLFERLSQMLTISVCKNREIQKVAYSQLTILL